MYHLTLCLSATSQRLLLTASGNVPQPTVEPLKRSAWDPGLQKRSAEKDKVMRGNYCYTFNICAQNVKKIRHSSVMLIVRIEIIKND
jgi:hypothetical protein